MIFKTLDNKRTVDQKIDFLDTTFTRNNGYDIIDIFVVTPSYVMRWDKISYRFYQSADYADALFKFNDYDNPFSLQLEDIILIPDKDSLERMYTSDKTANIEQDIIDDAPVIVTSKDNARTNFLIRKELRKEPTISKKERNLINENGVYTLIKE